VRDEVLSRRALNRATLERQLLLRRSTASVLDAVEHLVGLQAQLPLNPYTALWSRLERFRPESLAELLVARTAVRIVVMRGTIHLVSADDCLVLRPLMQPVLDAELARHGEHASALRGVDMNAVLAFARPLLAERPRTGAELRVALAERFPEEDAAALAYACRNRLPLVQAPPRGVWGRTGQVKSTTAESWLGRPLATDSSIDDVVLRYIAAFGPATAADVAAWSGLRRQREVVDRLRPWLRTFRAEHGRDLVDLPDAPRPDPETPAPPRFLPEYDNLLLSHADRTRFVSAQSRARLSRMVGPVRGSVLYDGFLWGLWRLERDGPDVSATLVISHVERRTRRATAEVAGEGRRLLRFIAADYDTHHVRFAAVD
jgi:Winged helix DNA-binding domain